MAFALSQILVYSDAADGDQPMRAFYQDILIRNAFGNYRDLLEEVTYSSAMGEWLTYRGNRKGDPSRGRMPDENYAREILQLFSIGLIELNRDGSPKLDAQGQQIETYTNADIEKNIQRKKKLGKTTGNLGSEQTKAMIAVQAARDALADAERKLEEAELEEAGGGDGTVDKERIVFFKQNYFLK